MHKKTPDPSSAPQAPSPSADELRRAKDEGTELLLRGRLEEALAAFKEVVKAAPHEPLHRQKVAEILQRLGRTQEAIAEFEAAAEGWARTGWQLRAMALCKVILQLDPRHTRTQALLASLHSRREPPKAGAAPQAPREAAPAPDPAKRRFPEALAASAPEESTPFFSDLKQDVFLEVLLGIERHMFKPGQVIVKEGAPGRSMFIIVEGQASVVRQDAAGKPVTLATLGEGEFFGEVALLGEAPRLSTVVAEAETVVLELSRERMEAIAERHPHMHEVVQRLYRQRLLANALRSNPLFAGWPELLRQLVSEAFTPVSVQAGEEILTRGQPAHALYVLLRGQCTVFHPHVDGRQTHYPDMIEGDVFGEVSLLRTRLVTASVKAVTPCVLLKLERAAIDELLPRHPRLHRELERLGAERLERTSELLSARPLHVGDKRV